MPEWWFPLLAAPFAGSVLGVLIRRLPAGRPVLIARSACETCGHRLGWAELVPLLSYLVQRGRCRACGAAVGWFHPAIELAALPPAAWAVLAHQDPALAWQGAPGLWADCVFGWMLLALAAIDWAHGRLPDALTLPLLALGLGVTGWLDADALTDHAIGAAAGYGAFWLVRAVHGWLRGREGLGLGDVKLFAAAGAWVGWQGLYPVMLGGALLSIGLALWLGRGRAPGGQAVPFGPGLALAAFAVRLHGGG